MKALIQNINDFNNKIKRNSLDKEIRIKIIRFFNLWKHIYSDIYYLTALEKYKLSDSLFDYESDSLFDYEEDEDYDMWEHFDEYIEKKEEYENLQPELYYDVDIRKFRKDIWEEALLKFNDPNISNLLYFVDPEEIPCPIEEYSLFIRKIKELLEYLFNERRVIRDELIKGFTECISKYPIQEMPYLEPYEPEFIFKKSLKESSNNITLKNYPGSYSITDIKDDEKNYHVYIPNHFPWQTKNGKPNFHIPDGSFTYEQLERLILTLLLAFPLGKVKISFLDLGYSSQLSKLRNKLPSEVKDSLVLNSEELNKWIVERQQKLRDYFERFGDLTEYNTRQNKIDEYYEIGILNCIEQCDISLRERLRNLVKDGNHAGIYFVVLGSLPSKWDKTLFHYLEVNNESEFTSLNPVTLYNSKKRERLFGLIKKELEEKENDKSLKQGYIQNLKKQELYSCPYNDKINDFVVDIGFDIDNGQTIYFKLDEQIHVHTFVLGKTGSGKSVFLNTLLNKAMLKYSPENLQFYLLDFKMGGVELDRYKSYPHVRALLVDESDPGITLEILRDLQNKMRKRGELMRAAGCQNLKDYNNENPNKRMPRIILLVDECHVLFEIKEHKIQDEISQIIEKIAKEGRSQGVHLILATQTLSGFTIPREVKSQITDPYLLYCEPIDAQYFVDNPSRIINRLPTYGAYHKDRLTGREEFFIPTKLDKDEMKNCLNAILQKCMGIQLNFRIFYFTGSQNFKLLDGLKGITYSRYAVASLGRSLEIQSKNILVNFKKEVAQNMVIVGNNDKRQGLRILIVSIISLVHYHKLTNTPARFIFFVNEDLDDDPELDEYINILSKYNVEILESRGKRQNMLKELYNKINNSDCVGNTTFLFISSQDNYAELKQDSEISVSIPNRELSPQQKEENKLFFNGLNFGNESKSKVVTTRKVWEQILECGPEKGLFTVLQVSKIDRLLFKESVYAKQVYKYFQHFVFLRTLAEVSAIFGLEEIHLDKLSDEPEKLRACYMNATNNRSIILSPYQMPTLNELDELLR